MTRPPYLRRAAALMVLVAALFIEFRPTTTERIPVALTALPAGGEITDSDVRWLAVESGLEPVGLPAVLARQVVAGAPITASDLDSAPIPVPGDWLRIELPVPETTANGTMVVVVLPSRVADRPVSGVVVGPPSTTDFEGLAALVAFAPADAVIVARGLMEGQVTVLLGP